MDEVFQSYLRKFVLVFFDDILIYNRTWVEHIQLLRLVFVVLQQHQLFLKRSKCSFGETKVTYLGHVILEKRVLAYDSKISTVTEWPVPGSAKALRGFLGLSGYYRKFVKDYGILAAPLTSLLKKNSFHWTPMAE